MQLIDTQVHALTRDVWDSVLGIEISLDDPHTRKLPDHMITGFVHINGVWDGAVLLHCSLTMAKRAAALIFRCNCDEVEAADLHDVLGELANMVGGNVKSLLPGPCSLSLPTVVEGSDYRLVVRDSRPMCQTAYDCEGEPVLVTVLERAESERRK